MSELLGNIFILIMAAVVGVGSAWLTNLIETKRREKQADAEWTVTLLPLATVKKAGIRGWIIINTGTRAASDVTLEIPGHGIVREPDQLTTFKPSEGDMFFIEDSNNSTLPRVKVSWTSHRDEAKDLRLLLPIV